jgi:hypothetical protein
MLRALLLLLLLANLVFWGWTQGWLTPIGMAPTSQREPERLQQQVAAQQVRIIGTGSARPATPGRPTAASAPAAAPASAAAADAGTSASCQQTAALTSATAGATEADLAKALPARPWQRIDTAATPLPYAVAMTGLNAATFQVKQTELQRISIPTEPLRSPNGGVVGLVLGRYADRAAADAAMSAFGKRGVRTARVISGVDTPPAVRLRIDPVSDDVAAILRGWNAKAAEPAVFRACAAS